MDLASKIQDLSVTDNDPPPQDESGNDQNSPLSDGESVSSEKGDTIPYEVAPIPPSKPVSSVPNYCGFYEPLNPAKREIRLVLLYPKNSDWPEVTVGLMHISLQDEKVTLYRALSYCWGSTDDYIDIPLRKVIDDEVTLERRFNITRNLHAALSALRHETQFLPFWIDAICINQSDNDEKTDQFSMMADIYSNALWVEIWLGEEDDTWPILYHFIMLQDRDLRRSNPENTPGDLVTEKGLDRYVFGVVKHMPAPEELTDKAREFYRNVYIASARLFSRPWFRRAWVLQEANNSRRPALVRVGKDCVYWGSIILLSYWHANAYVYVDDWQEQLTLVGGSKGEIPKLWWLLAYAGSERRLTITDILFSNELFETTDCRDSIWALLSLANDTYQINELPELMRPNYSKVPTRACIDFTRGLIQKNRSLEILALVPTSVDPTLRLSLRHSGLPTWVADYDTRGVERGLQLLRCDYFDATAGSDVVLGQHLDDSQICIQGLRYDRIKAVYPGRGGIEDMMKEHRDAPDRPVKEALERYQELFTSWLGESVRGWLLVLIKNTADTNETQSALDRFLDLAFLAKDTLDFYKKESVPHLNKLIRELESPIEQTSASGTSSSAVEADDIDLKEELTWPMKAPPMLYADFAAWWQSYDPEWSVFQERERQVLRFLAPSGDAERFLVTSNCVNRTLFITSQNNIGLGPVGTHIGDHVCLLSGGRVPFILRTSVDESEPPLRDPHGRAQLITTFGYGPVGFECYPLLPDPFREIDLFSNELLSAEFDPSQESNNSITSLENRPEDKHEQQGPFFELLGECYAEGLMDGSVWQAADRDGSKHVRRYFHIR